jgi:thioredoxin 1
VIRLALFVFFVAIVAGCRSPAQSELLPAAFPATPEAAPLAPVDPNVEILDFYADWCGPCKAAKPEIDRLEREGHRVVRCNADDAYSQGLKQKYRVTSVPTFIVLVDGRETFRTHNVQELRHKLEERK